VLSIGDNCLDVYLEQDVYAVGGNALNVAVNWHRAGFASRYRGAVGNDLAAPLVLDGIAGAGLDTSTTSRRPGRTGVTFLGVHDGDRQLLLEEFGVGLEFGLTDAEVEEAARHDWVHVVGTGPEAALVPRLVAAGARVSVDLSTSHHLDDLPGVEIAFASGAETDLDASDELAARMLDAGARHAVVTRGPAGSISRGELGRHAVAATAAEVVDTCGAGDRYIATFLHRHLRGAPVADAMTAAATDAASTCGHFGGWRQPLHKIPSWLRREAAAHDLILVDDGDRP
jgi:fructoselysine 6-kinase